MPCILVVDDDQDVRLMLTDRLEFLGYHTAVARDGLEGMAKLRTQQMDGMLLDMQMPVMDGLTMLTVVREQYPDLPVIVISGEHHMRKLMQALTMGARDYLLKPIDVHALEKKCQTIFRGT